MMKPIKITRKEQAQQIYEYCRQRLPIMEGYSLSVESNYTVTSDDKQYVMNGVTLKIHKGHNLIAVCTGIDEDDALLDIYKQLLYFYRQTEGKKLVAKKALGHTHFSYK